MGAKEDYLRKFQHVEEDEYYARIEELYSVVQYAVKYGHISEEEGRYYLDYPEEGFRWLYQ